MEDLTSAIEGVTVTPLRRFPDERGCIFHMLRESDPHFIRFGEIYFSRIDPGVVKGWHKHRDMTLNYCAIVGRVKVVIYDDREGSPTCGKFMEIFLGPENYALLTVAPGLWNGHRALGGDHAIIANCATHVHDPSRSERRDPINGPIRYDWNLRSS